MSTIERVFFSNGTVVVGLFTRARKRMRVVTVGEPQTPELDGWL
jgi:hypothetical protein